MRPKVSVFIATSADGYIARRDGAIDWLDGDGTTPHEDHGYDAFMATVDALVMGRHTFETVLGFGHWPFDKTPVTVLSSRPYEIPEALRQKVSTSSLAPAALLAEMAARGTKHVYLDGGKTIQSFLREGLVDEMIISHLPVLIGSGIPLFGELPRDVPLKVVSTRSFAYGLVQVHYRIPPRS